MKMLKEAPVIVTCFGKNGENNPKGPAALAGQLAVIEAAVKRVRAQYGLAPKDGGDLRKVAEDIWALDEPIGLHTDGTAPGHRVIGLVLINEPGLCLFAENVVYDLPVGTVYHIDGHRRHGALARNEVQRGKLFAFLAWDVPSQTPIAELLADLLPSLEAYAKGEVRVNILKEP